MFSRKSFIVQQFQINQRFRMIIHYLFHQFSRKFDILNRIRTINVHVNIIYKRKTQKINSMNIEIINESISKTNFKWKELLKSLIMLKFVEQLFVIYDFFLTFKFLKIKQNFKLTLKRLQKMFFRHETVFARTRTNIEIILSTKNCFNLKLQWNRQNKIRNYEKSKNSNDVTQNLINFRFFCFKNFKIYCRQHTAETNQY